VYTIFFGNSDKPSEVVAFAVIVVLSALVARFVTPGTLAVHRSRRYRLLREAINIALSATRASSITMRRSAASV